MHCFLSTRYLDTVVCGLAIVCSIIIYSCNGVQGCALAEPGGPWCLTFVLRRLESLSFSIEIICWAHWISQRAPFNFSYSTALVCVFKLMLSTDTCSLLVLLHAIDVFTT